MALTQSPGAETGTKAPDFSLPGTDGKLHALRDSRGPLGLLVMFICNHCPYVKAIQDRLVEDVKAIQKAGIGVVAISANDPRDYPEDSPENMKLLARQLGFTFPYLFDATQSVARAFGAVCTPEFFGFNANLELQYRGRLDAAHKGPRLPDTKRELVDAMMQIARTGKGPKEQVPSMGCSIKWTSSAR
jgi:peroxiredoxin